MRKNCSVKGVVLGKTEKRVKVQCASIEGVYQIATKNVVVEMAAIIDSTEEE